MRFFFGQRSCSIGIHVLLEEIGLSYEQERLDFATRQQMAPEYRALNPKGKVPALLRDDGSILTEFQTIAYWLARAYPAAGLIGDDLEDQIRTLEFMDYVVGSVHMRGFTLHLMPQKFVTAEACQAEVKAHGTLAFTDGLAQMSQMLDGRDHVRGRFSIADAAAFYVTRWAVAQNIGLPDNLAAFHRRMLDRPAVRAALEKEAAG